LLVSSLSPPLGVARRGAAAAKAQNTLGDFLSKEQEAETNLDVERAHLQEQRKTLTKLRNGTRVEEIAQSQAEVIQAKAQLQFYNTRVVGK
jgi:ABC-type Fe3+-citrate transport system substrate-binding protein